MANRISILVALEGADEGLKRAITSAERSLGGFGSSAKTAGDKAAAGRVAEARLAAERVRHGAAPSAEVVAAAHAATEAERLAAFREARDEIRWRVASLWPRSG